MIHHDFKVEVIRNTSIRYANHGASMFHCQQERHPVANDKVLRFGTTCSGTDWGAVVVQKTFDELRERYPNPPKQDSRLSIQSYKVGINLHMFHGIDPTSVLLLRTLGMRYLRLGGLGISSQGWPPWWPPLAHPPRRRHSLARVLSIGMLVPRSMIYGRDG